MSDAAQRIVSLLPGATEWICQLGLTQRLVGVSHECDYPAEVNALPRVTRSHVDITWTSQQIDETVRNHSETKTPLYELDSEAIERLNPDLILTQSLCDVCAVSERQLLSSISSLKGECRLLDLSAQTFEQVLDDALAIADVTGRQPQSLTAIESLQRRIERVQGENPLEPRPVTLLLEWVNPIFCSGHWTPQLIEWAGGVDPLGRTGEASREIAPNELIAADPDVLLVACCGLSAARSAAEIPLLEQIHGWSDLRCVQNHQVHALDGSSYFNRPGPRLVDALELVCDTLRIASCRSTHEKTRDPQ